MDLNFLVTNRTIRQWILFVIIPLLKIIWRMGLSDDQKWLLMAELSIVLITVKYRYNAVQYCKILHK